MFRNRKEWNVSEYLNNVDDLLQVVYMNYQPQMNYFIIMIILIKGFPGGSVVKNPPTMQETQETWVLSLGWENPLEEGMATYSSILA